MYEVINLVDLIDHVSLIRGRALNRVIKPLAINRAQWCVLAILYRQDDITQSQLADALNLSKVTVGQLIDGLEQSGMVRRTADPEDRRINRLLLEPLGSVSITRLISISHAFGARARGELADLDLEDAAHTLGIIKCNLLRYLKSDKSNKGDGQADDLSRNITNEQ